MSQKEKLVERLLKYPKDFTFSEMVTLLNYFEYHINNGGKSTGSGVHFYKKGSAIGISFHRPHPNNICKKYVLKSVVSVLQEEGLI